MKASQLIGCRAGICATLAAGVIGVAAGAGPISGAIADRGASGVRDSQLAREAASTSSAPGAATGTDVFGAAQTAAGGGATQVATAINANGNSLVAWDDETGLGHTYVRTAGDKGILGPLQTLWIGAGYHIAASLASDGTGAVSWLTGQSLMAAVARPGHGFGTAQTVASSINSTIGSQTVVATPGRAVALWLATPSSGGASAIEYAIAGSGGKFGSSKSLGASDIQPPLLAAYDTAGDVIVAYWTTPSTSTTAAAGAETARAATTTTTKTTATSKTTTSKTSTSKTSTTTKTATSKTKKPTKPKPSPSKPTGQLAYVVLPAGTNTFSSPQTIATLTGTAKPSANLTLASGPGGVAVGYTGNFFNVAPLGATGPAGPIEKAGAVPTATGTTIAPPTVAVPTQGGTVAAWSESTAPKGSGADTTGHIVISQQQTSGTFTPQDLTASTTLSQSPLAAATKDLAILVFGEGPESNELLDYSVRQTGGSFSTPQPLSSTALVPPVTAPSTTSVLLQPIPASLAADGTHAVVAWLDGETLLASFLTG